jgi:predicted nuclease with RNAse H fold
MAYYGFDPGGENSFGVAVIQENGHSKCYTVSSALQAFQKIEARPIGVGIDAPLWWSKSVGGGRYCDEWIRKTYGIPAGSVQSVNSLRGAAIAQGLLLGDMITKSYPGCMLTESNPKAVVIAMDVGFDDFLRMNVRTANYTNDHERDALVAALSAKLGMNGSWRRDLSEIKPEAEIGNQPFDLSARYFWPG